MHNHVDHRWIKTVLRKIISILLVYSLFFTSTANAAVGGWDLRNPVAQGASAVYDATKNVVINGKKFIKESSVKITPTATQVAKTIGRTAGVIIAIEALIGAVDWVLDPANNRVIYYEDPPAKEMLPKLWVWDSRMDGKDGVSTAEQACRNAAFSKEQALATGNYMYTVYKSVSLTDQDTALCIYDAYNTYSGQYYGTSNHTVTRKVNSAYNPEAEDDRREKYLPYDAVAQKLISNAQAGQPEAQAHTMAAAANTVAEAEKDDAKARPIASQAEANATTKPADAAEAEKANEAQGEAKPNEANPEATDLSITFPIFCNWAPTICEAAQTVISFPQTLTTWWETGKSKAEEWALSISEAWTAAKEWAKNDENEDTDNDPPEIQEIDIGALDTSTFQGVAGCPAPIQVPITFGTGGETEISYEPICQLADKWSFVAPLIGFLSGAMILVGVGRKGEDGEI